MTSDAILDVCTYHRRDFDLVVVRSRPHEMERVAKSLQTSFDFASTSGLGQLDRLPNELLCMVLQNLDLLSYFRFRQINRQARAVSTAVSEYRSVAKHGLEGLRGLLRAGLAQTCTIRGLYNGLISERCALCGSFGGFLFLPTVTRCCFDCIRDSPDLRVISTSTFSRLTKISTKRLHHFLGSQLRTVPGLYSMWEKRVKRPKFLVAARPATAKLVELGVLKQDAVQAVLKHIEQKDQRFMVSTAFPWYDLRSKQLERGVSCKGCQVRLETLRADGMDRDRDRVFSRSSYLSHFKSCSESRKLWDQSEGGTRHVQEPEFTRRCGYINTIDNDGLPR